jgi:response regulator of citrate/malate metabolism
MFYVRGASFWQQDQAWRDRSRVNQSNLDVVTAVTSKMSTALTSLSSGLASIANQRALSRVQTQIKAATASLSSGTIPATSSKAIPVNLLSLDTIGTAADTTGNVVDKTA